jgi:hypothetical protein
VTRGKLYAPTDDDSVPWEESPKTPALGFGEVLWDEDREVRWDGEQTK